MRALWIAAIVAAAGESRADPAHVVRLTVETGDDCVTDRQLRTAVRERLGRDPFRDDAAELLHVSVVRDGAFHARIERTDGSGQPRGTRELDASDCSELAETLSLSIAIAIEPLHAEHTEPSAPARPSIAAAASPAPSASRASAPIAGWLGVGAVGTLGAQPAPSYGAALQLGVHRDWLVAGLSARFDRAARRTVDTVEISAATAAVVALGCVVLDGPRLCAQAGIARVHGQARGVTMPRADSTDVGLIGARVAWAWSLGVVRLVPQLEVNVATARTSFAIDGMPVLQASRVHGALGLVVERDFL